MLTPVQDKKMTNSSENGAKSVNKNVARFRWLIFVLGNVANCVIFIVLNGFSLIVVAMIAKNDKETLDPDNFQVNWSNMDKSRMLSASFWGSMIMSLFGGRICELFGPRRVVSLSLLVNGLATLLFPTISVHSFIGAYIIRIINGICTGIVRPSSDVIVSRWSIISERTLAITVLSSGNALANLISLPLAGIMVSSSFLGGWPSVFYLFGGLNLIIAIIWYFLVYDTPEVHPYLSHKELEVILKNRSVASGDSVKVPWVKMFTSIPIIAYLIAAFTYGWVVGVVSSQIPSFYEDIFSFSYASNGFVASLPWLVGMGAQLIGSAITDKIRISSNFSLSTIRKTVTVISLGSCSFGLLAIPLLGKRKIPVVLALAIAKGMGTLSVAGCGVNHLDIAPSFAGTLAGLFAFLLNLAMLIANESAAHIVGNNSSQWNWYKYFYITAVINLIGVIIFCLMGSGEIQHWDPSSSIQSHVKSQTIEKIDEDRENERNDIELLTVEI